MAKKPPSRISGQKILSDLRLAAKKGDRATLTLALDQMRTLARNPLARLIDMLMIKQGERIAHQKGWKLPKPAPPTDKPRKPATKAAKARAARSRAAAAAAALQISLFE